MPDVSIQQSIQRRKRQANLLASSKPLNEQLDELREMLSGGLAELEELLEVCIGEIPSWASQDPDELRQLYEIEVDGQSVTMGPRAASVVAARIEVFIADWVTPDAADARPTPLPESDIEAFEAALGTLRLGITQVSESGREAANQVQTLLEQRLREIEATEAEPSRSDRLDALRSRLKAANRKSSGPPPLPSKVRPPKPTVTEEQREQLRETWGNLEQLAFAAAQMGAEAEDRLTLLVDAAVDAAVAAYPELGGEAPAESAPIRVRKFNVPELKPAEREGLPSTQPEEGHRTTLELDRPQTDEYPRDPDSEELPRERLDTDAHRAVRDTPAPSRTDGSAAPETVIIDISTDSASQDAEVETLAEPTAPGADDYEPAELTDAAPGTDELDAVGPAGDVATAEYTSVPAMDLPTADYEQVTQAARTVELDIASEPFNDEPSGPREPAFRVTDSWQAVSAPEVGLVLGLPALYIVFIMLATLAYQVGLWSENPFRAWPWAGWTFALFAVWAVGMPAWLGWRVRWDGYRPRPFSRKSRRESAVAQLNGALLTIGETRVDLRATTSTLRRWREPGEHGWALDLTGPVQVVLASEATQDAWEASSSPTADAQPDGEWRVSEKMLLAIHDECVSR